MKMGGIDTSEILYVPDRIWPSIKKYTISSNDLFISVAGTLGLVGFIPDELNGANLTENADKLTNIKCNTRFLYFVLSSPLIQNIVKSTQTKNAQPKLAIERINEFNIPIPPLPEQKKIAKILSAWDRAIEQTRQLLEAKQKLKKGLMQQLLTGRLRFPQFGPPAKNGQIPEGWQEVRLKDVLKVISRPIMFDDNKYYQLISVRRRSGGLFYRATLKGDEIATKDLYLTRTGDFLISKMQVVHGALGLVTEEFDSMYISGSYISLNSKSKDDLDIRFFNYLSTTKRMYHNAFLSSYGVHIEKMTFNLSLYLKSHIIIPRDLVEQKVIVDCIDHLNKNIITLKIKIDNLELQKKGMMQKLLTGEIRVKTDQN